MEHLKLCTKCEVAKPLSAFSSNGAGIVKARCKPCRSQDVSLAYAAKTPEKKKEQMARIKQWVKANPDKYRSYARKTRASNPDHYRLKVQLRRRRHRLATPAWADAAAIKSFYLEAAKRTAETGIRHEVDHIVPLKSPIVCGLHCEANLQILPMPENRVKNNRRWPDMP